MDFYSKSLKMPQRKALLAEHLVATQRLKQVKRFRDDVVFSLAMEEATEETNKHLKHLYSYDILASPYYSTKFNYYPASTPYRLNLVSCLDKTKMVDSQASSTIK
jgi:hypothetical protein